MTGEPLLFETRVIDSDTLHCWIEVADGLAIQERLRIVGIEGGEFDTEKGQINAARLHRIIKTDQVGSLRFVGHRRVRDNHGRVVGDIRLANGSLLSQTLLQTGLWTARTAYRCSASSEE